MKERKSQRTPNWAVRCLSVPGPDTDLTLHVSFDSERFVIGCGEGTQRAFAQKQRQLKGIQAVLLPNAQAKTRAGLPGMLMTLADAGLPKLDVIGTSDTAHYLATLRSCVIRDKFPVHAISHPVDGSPNEPIVLYESPSITISGISLVPPSLLPATSSSANTPASASNSYKTADITPNMHATRPSLLPPPELEKWRNMAARGILGKPFRLPSKAEAGAHDPSQPSPPASGAPIPHFDGVMYPSWPEQRFPLPLPSEAESEMEMVYFFQAAEVRGKLDVQKADALGVPRPSRSAITRGESVWVDLPGGGRREVKPEECLIGGGPGSAMIVVSCSSANLDTLLASTAFHRYQPDRSGASTGALTAHVVVHRVEHSIWANERYRAWMKTFGSSTQHLFADPTRPTESTYFRSSAWNAAQLSVLDNDIFFTQQPDIGSSAPPPPLPTDIVASHLTPYTEVRMYPRGDATDVSPAYKRDEPLPIDVAAAREDSLIHHKKANGDTARGVADREAFETAVAAARSAIAAEAVDKEHYDGPGADMRITTLGTGSAIPSKYRNVSATMLEVPNMLQNGGAGMVLLDCGEGTLGQMRRLYGMQGMKRVYGELKMILVSHMHADHHLGLQSILEDRFKSGITAPLFLLAPPQIALALQENASWQSRAIASDEALDNVFFLNSARFLRSPVTPLPAESDASATTGTDMDPAPESVARPDDATLNGNGGYASGSEPEDATWSIFASKHTRAPRHLKGLLPLAAPAEWGRQDRERGTRRWPEEDVLGWSREINERQHVIAQSLVSALNLSAIQCVQVPHRGYATALILDHSSGWRVVYSGDTKPSDKLARLGKDATVLIHEATIEDDKPEMADAKGHSTFGQAIDVGRKMGAKHVLLNHFSQRYPKLPDLDLSDPSTRAAKPASDSAPASGTHVPAAANVDELSITNATSSAEEQSLARVAGPAVEISVAMTHVEPSGVLDTAGSSAGTNGGGIPSQRIAAPSPAMHSAHPIVAMSFDFMSVKVRDMYKVRHYLPAIAEFYKDEEDGEGAVSAQGGDEESLVNGGEAKEGGGAKGKNHKQKQPQQQQSHPKQPKAPKPPKGQRGGQASQAGWKGDRKPDGPERGVKRSSEEGGVASDGKESKKPRGDSVPAPEGSGPRDAAGDAPQTDEAPAVAASALAPEQADL